MPHVSPPTARDPRQLCPLVPPPSQHAKRKAAALTFCPPAAWVTPWELALAQRGGREEGRGGGELGSFPQCTSAVRIKMESGGGEHRQRSNPEGKAGTLGGWGGTSRVVKAGQLHPHIPCYLGLSCVLLARRFGAGPAVLSPPPAPLACLGLR